MENKVVIAIVENKPIASIIEIVMIVIISLKFASHNTTLQYWLKCHFKADNIFF